MLILSLSASLLAGAFGLILNCSSSNSSTTLSVLVFLVGESEINDVNPTRLHSGSWTRKGGWQVVSA